MLRMMGKKISVVIPTLNRLNDLKRLLCVFNNEPFPRSDFEVIVIDDGSSDGTQEFLRSWKGPFPLRPIFHEQNRGSATSRNDGIKAARYDIVLFLDDDLVPRRGILTHHSRHHNGKRCAVIGNIRYRETVMTRWVSRYLSSRGVHKIPPDTEIPFTCFWTSNASIQKEPLFRVGLFDEDFKVAGGEDTELAYRLERMGVEFRYEEEAVCFHKPVTLPELLRKNDNFRMNALPLLLEKNEIFREVFQLSRISNPFIRFVTIPLIYRTVRSVSPLLNSFYLPPILIDYLLFSERVRVR
jgi:glycosyltransferase involved in cell wall biosynthesis